MATYVIKSWKADEHPDEQGRYVHIRGRLSGFVSWLLSLGGVEPTVTISVTNDKFVFKLGSLSGFVNRVIPLRSVSSTIYGYKKPLVESIAIIILGLWFGISLIAVSIGQSSSFGASPSPSPWGLLVIIAFIVIAIIYYNLNKKLSLGIVEVGSILSAVEFKKGVVENLMIDERQAEFVVSIIQQLTDRQVSRAP